MAEVILLPVAKSILSKLQTAAGGFASDYVGGEIKAAMSATKDLEAIADKLTAMCAVLQDADQKQYENQAIQVWFKDLKSVVYDIDNLLDEVAYDALERRVNKGHFGAQLRYYASPSSNPLVARFRWSHKFKDLRGKLDHVVSKKNDFGLTERPVEAPPVQRDPYDVCAVMNVSTVLGRDEAKTDIINKLQQGASKTSTPTVLPIVGLGGLGKTTVAKLVYNDVDQFDIKLWACVSDKFDLKKLFEDLIKSAAGLDNSHQDIGQLTIKLRDMLTNHRYFLVLDDLWMDDIVRWTDLLNLLAVGRAGSVILITTRIENVASVTQTIAPYNLDRLSDSICESIFEKLVFKEVNYQERYPNLVKIGKSIIKNCGGVPLVAKCFASQLRGTRDEYKWSQIQEESQCMKLHGPYDNVLRLLKLSYDKLPSHLKSCFAYTSFMPKGSDIFLGEQICVWNALGLLNTEANHDNKEDHGYNYLSDLLSQSLFQEPGLLGGKVTIYKMHDMLHDVATNILGEEVAVVSWGKPEVSKACTHILWDYESYNNILSDKEFPKQLGKANKAKTFKFRYGGMGRISVSFLEGIITNFPCLRILYLSGGHFEELPMSIGSLKHLRYLDVGENPLLKELPSTVSKLLNLESLYMGGCDNLKELPKNISRLLNLSCLLMTTCEQVSLVGTKFNRLSSLQELYIWGGKRLESLWEDGDVGGLVSLRKLFVIGCPKLKSLPKSMKLLVALNELCIGDCEKLEVEEEVFSGLQSLVIGGSPRLTRLPNSLQTAAASLQYLEIGGLTELPNWLQSFTSLIEMRILSCPALSALPQGFHHLRSLQKLTIENCEGLSGRCAKPDGEDYHLIQHVPEFWLDDLCITSPTN